MLLWSPDQVEVLVHGTYYATWNRILRYGLTSSRGFIPCFPFVPVEQVSSQPFQLYIFINVRAAMADGIKFFKTSEQQILCSGRSKGVLPAKYFSKVVDAETREIIYPPQHNSYAFGPGVHNQSGPRPCGGRGRGRGRCSEQSQPIQLYQDIWSQVQRMDSDHVDLRPVQTQMLTQLLNINPDSPTTAAPPVQSKAQTREVTVQDIFQGVSAHAQQSAAPPKASMGDNDILSLLNAAQPTLPHHRPGQPDNSNSSSNNKSHKSSSPTKSAFVPTQVIRKQTPRKPKNNLSGTHSNPQGSVTDGQSLHNHEENQQQLTTQHQQQVRNQEQQNQSQQKQDNNGKPGEGATAKPKRQLRNRLAMKFDQYPADK